MPYNGNAGAIYHSSVLPRTFLNIFFLYCGFSSVDFHTCGYPTQYVPHLRGFPRVTTEILRENFHAGLYRKFLNRSPQLLLVQLGVYSRPGFYSRYVHSMSYCWQHVTLYFTKSGGYRGFDISPQFGIRCQCPVSSFHEACISHRGVSHQCCIYTPPTYVWLEDHACI